MTENLGHMVRSIAASMMLACAFSADYVTVTTKDGRSITGYYDAAEGTVSTVKPKATVRLRPEDIVSVTKATTPEQAKIQDGSVDIVQQLKDRIVALEADRDKATSAAAKARALAEKARDKDDAKSLNDNAAASDAEARGYQVKIDVMAAKLAQLSNDKKAAEPVADEKPKVSEIAQMRIQVQAASDATKSAHAAEQALNLKLRRMIADANRAFVMTGDLEPVPMSTSARPTKEENDRVLRIAGFNSKLEQLRAIRERSKNGGENREHSDHQISVILGSENDGTGRPSTFWLSYSELKNKPAPY